MDAIPSCDSNIVKQLFNNCTNIPRDELNSALAVSVLQKKVEITKQLLTIGADDFRSKQSIIQALLQVCGDTGPSTGNLRFNGRLQGCVMDALNGVYHRESEPYVSPLVLAMKFRDNKTIRFLLQRVAAMNNNLEACELLLKNGAKVNRPLSRGKQATSALLIAVQKVNVEMVGLLIRSGARLNDRFQGAPETMLGAALERGYKPLIELLEGAVSFSFGQMFGCIGNIGTAVSMQEKGILENVLKAPGPTILTTAIVRGDDALTHWLQEHDIDVDVEAVNRWNKPNTPLGAAIGAGNLSLIRTLVDWGTRVTEYHIVQAIDDSTAFTVLLYWDPRLIGRALTKAILVNDEDLTETLLEWAVDVNQEVQFDPMLNSDGNKRTWLPYSLITPLQAAARCQNLPLVLSLLERGSSSVNHQPEIAAMKGYLGVSRRFMDLGADVNAPAGRYSGRTALARAAEYGRIDMVHLLLSCGALVITEGPAYEGQNPLRLAEGNAHYAVVDLLRSFEPEKDGIHAPESQKKAAGSAPDSRMSEKELEGDPSLELADQARSVTEQGLNISGVEEWEFWIHFA
ncbi:ankyrin repeat domain-containing protein [Aspergillus undulatus]|uniref:ankyrin repeat domain-containing protein n=1 Tax=Aspergillus undulatus TaxID=1810928 RepID=UPI003CCCC354